MYMYMLHVTCYMQYYMYNDTLIEYTHRVNKYIIHMTHVHVQCTWTTTCTWI